MSALKDIEHVVVGGGQDLLSLWPRHGGLWSWGSEVLTAYIESPCSYRHSREAAHDLGGVLKRGYMRLRRSRDSGIHWEDAGKLFDNSLPIERQRRILRMDEYRGHAGPEREIIDMTFPDSILLMGRAWCGAEVPRTGNRSPVVHGFRSPDRGQRWESAPSILWPERSSTLVEVADNVLRLEPGRLLCWVVGSEGIDGAESAGAIGPQLYVSEDHGAQWGFYAEVARDVTGKTAFPYPHVLPLPSGRWLCFMGAWDRNWSSRRGWAALCSSDDAGLNWSAPRRIAVWTHAPFPLRLRDGRLLLIYTRCAPDPAGLYIIESEDDGQRWSRPALLRGAELPAGPRGEIVGAYPVARELSDGRILATYGWQHDDEDVPWYGGRGFIAGTFFRLE